MILHKYLDGCYNTLSDLELKVSIPSELNDPFEFLPQSLTKREVKKFLNRDKNSYEKYKNRGEYRNRQEFKLELQRVKHNIDKAIPEDFQKVVSSTIKDTANKNLRFISFSSEYSSSLNEVLMWSHYSKGHCGLRYHFDSNLLIADNTSCELEEIKYLPERCKINHLHFIYQSSEQSKKVFKNLLYTKSEAWKYECEYKLMIFPPSRCIFKENMYFFKFNPKSLIRIDLGYKF